MVNVGGCFSLHVYFVVILSAFAGQGPIIVRHPRNSTGLVGRRHTLHCRVTGSPTPRVAWQRSKQPHQWRRLVGGHHHVTRTGGLRFQPLHVTDSALYRCVAQNKHGITRSRHANLFVQAPVEIVDGPTDRFVEMGGEVRLTCASAGIPYPRITWFKDGQQVLDVTPTMVYTKSILIVNVTETVKFECRVQNEHIEGVTIRSKTATVTVLETVKHQTGECVAYNGSVCQQHLRDDAFYYTDLRRSGDVLVRRLSDGVLSSLHPACRSPAIRLACHAVFPDCHESEQGMPTGKPLCREDCELVKDRLCPSEWTIMESLKSAGHDELRLLIPECSGLPSLVNDSHLCSHAWFYDVGDNSSEVTIGLTSDYDITLETAAVICAMTAVSLCLLSLISMLCCRLRVQYHRLSRNAGHLDISTKLPSNACYHQRPAEPVDGPLAGMECARDDIVYVQELGEGAFGRVFAARTPALGTIAVKMLREDASTEMRTNFIQQAALLAALRHAHVVRLYGVCTRGPAPACMLLEYMHGGALNDWLRARRPPHYINRDGDTLDSAASSDTPDLAQKLRFILHVASAMTHLSERGYVHRDLASRNCLVSIDLVVKLADFGLTRPTGTAAGAADDAVPVRWLPLEALLQRRFTPESDVWAFGVLAWEVFAYARQPYAGLTPEQVVRYVGSGGVLPCPDGTPRDAYDMMRLCWSRKPQHRPPFATLLRFTTALLDEATHSNKGTWGSITRTRGSRKSSSVPKSSSSSGSTEKCTASS